MPVPSVPAPARPGARRALGGIVLACAVSAVALFTVAAWSYPGGTYFDPRSVGHDFWRNAICDVARSTAIGGAPNAVGAAFARAAMSIMAVGIGAMFWLLPERFSSRPKLAALVRGLGAVTVPATIAVVLLPSDRFAKLHGLAIVTAGVPGLGAALLATVGLVLERARQPVLPVLATATLLVAAADFAVYVDEIVTGGPARVAMPVLQRVAALLLVAWMIASARGSRG